MRILLVSNMYPSPERPDFGVFVARLAGALERRGHTIDRAVLHAGRSGRLRSPARYSALLGRALRAAQRRPDVIYAHYLIPTGAIARTIASRTDTPYVLTAHGTDVRNAGTRPAVAAATRWATRRAAAVIAVSHYLAERIELPDSVPVEVIDCGVDTDLFAPGPRSPGSDDRGPRFLFVGSLNERKNVRRLVEAFHRLDRGTLTLVGSGPLQAELRVVGGGRLRVLGRLDSEGVAAELRRADVVCQPSLEEGQGQVLLEAMASGRPVVATRVGGPAELVTEACGVLVDPLDVEAIAEGMRRAAALPVPCWAGVAIAAEHSLERQAERVEAVLAAAAARRRPP